MQTESITIRCEREISGEYLTAGDTYRVQVGRRQVNFENIARGTGTFMPLWQYNRSVRDGSLVVVTA